MPTLKFKDDTSQLMAEENHANGMQVLGAYNGAIFIRLPIALQKPCPGNSCQCDYCKAHPEETPAWDTLAVKIPPDSNPTMAGQPASEYHTWTVHMPDTSAFFRLAEKLQPGRRGRR